MADPKNIIGKRFGKLVVVEFIETVLKKWTCKQRGERTTNRHYYLVECDCGRTKRMDARQFAKTKTPTQCSGTCIASDREYASKCKDLVDQILADLDSYTDCFFWPYGKHRQGYGSMNRPAFGEELVHRIICKAVHGPAPEDKPHALHECGNGHLGCVSPHCLYWGDHSQNMIDKVLHGRHNCQILDPDKVRQIRKMRKHDVSVSELSEIFGVHIQTIYGVLNKTRWSHVADE